MMIAIEQWIVHVADDAGTVRIAHGDAVVGIVQHIHARRAIGDVRFGICLGGWICVIGTADVVIVDVQRVVVVDVVRCR